jgi:hypothetical protein
MNKQTNFEFLSMAELSRIANNEGEDPAIRQSALAKLNAREMKHFGGTRFARYPVRVSNYVPGL